MPLDHLNRFAMVLRGVHGKVNICQTDYSIYLLQTKIAPLFSCHTWKYNIQAIERLTRVKEKKTTINHAK